jgi:hypothetical protein
MYRDRVRGRKRNINNKPTWGKTIDKYAMASTAQLPIYVENLLR